LLKIIIRNPLKKLEKNFVEKTNIEVSTKTICTKCRLFLVYQLANLSNNRQREQRLKWCTERRDWTVRNGDLSYGVMKADLQYLKIIVQVVFGELPVPDLILKIWFQRQNLEGH